MGESGYFFSSQVPMLPEEANPDPNNVEALRQKALSSKGNTMPLLIMDEDSAEQNDLPDKPATLVTSNPAVAEVPLENGNVEIKSIVESKALYHGSGDPKSPDYIPSTDLPCDEQRPPSYISPQETDSLNQASFLPNPSLKDVSELKLPELVTDENGEIITRPIPDPSHLEVIINSKLGEISRLPVGEEIIPRPFRCGEYPWIPPFVPKENIVKLAKEEVKIERNTYGLRVKGEILRELWGRTKVSDKGESMAVSLPWLLRCRESNDCDDKDAWHTRTASGTEMISYVNPQTAEGLVLIIHGASLIFPEMERLGAKFMNLVSPENYYSLKLAPRRVEEAFKGIFPGLSKKVEVYNFLEFMAATYDKIISEPYAVHLTLKEASSCPSGDDILYTVLYQKPLPLVLFGGRWQTTHYLEDYKKKTRKDTHGFHHPLETICNIVDIAKEKMRKSGSRRAHFSKDDKNKIAPQGWPVHLNSLGSGRFEGVDANSGITSVDNFIVPLLDQYWKHPGFDIHPKDQLYEALCSEIPEEYHPMIKETLDRFCSPEESNPGGYWSRIKERVTSALRLKRKS